MTITTFKGPVRSQGGFISGAGTVGNVVTAETNPLTGEVSLSAGGISLFGTVEDPIKSVTISGGYAYLRHAWNSTLDALNKIRIYSTDQTINGVVDFYGVKTIPIATENNSVATLTAAFAAGTWVAPQGDSIGPLNYNGTFIGANHGPFIAHPITVAGHGKTQADIGSEWNGPASRKLYIFKIIDANTLLVVSDNTGTAAQWSFYLTSLSGQTLTHSYGATNTGNLVITSDAAIAQITPWLNNRTLSVLIDKTPINYAIDGIYYPSESFKILENYSVVSPAASITHMRSKVGSNPKFNDDGIFSDCSIQNIHSFQSTGAHTVDQTVTWNSAVLFYYQGCVQDQIPTNTGVLSQYVPGVGLIGGIDYKATADISGVISAFNAPVANWLDPLNAPSRMAQIVSVASVNKYGTVLGYSPLSGIGTRLKRAAKVATFALGLVSAATKKQYPHAVSSEYQPAVGDSYKVVGYHHVYNCEAVPDATVATWFVDGSDVVVVLDFHKVSATSRVILPAFCDGWRCSMIDCQNVNLLSDVVIDSGGVAVACTSTYGYAVIRVSKKI